MARQVLFVQGAGESVHDRWDDKLVASLRSELGPGYELHYPVMPDEADPKYDKWKPVLEKELASLRDGAIVVGHSVGGTVLVHTLAERAPPRALGAIVLIAAPFIGEGGWKSEDMAPRSDFALRLPRGVPVFLYHGRDDDSVPFAHVELWAKAIPGATVRRLSGRDHQLDNDLSEVARDITPTRWSRAASTRCRRRRGSRRAPRW